MIALSKIMYGGGGHYFIKMVSQLLPKVPVSTLLSEVYILFLQMPQPTVTPAASFSRAMNHCYFAEACCLKVMFRLFLKNERI